MASERFRVVREDGVICVSAMHRSGPAKTHFTKREAKKLADKLGQSFTEHGYQVKRW